MHDNQPEAGRLVDMDRHIQQTNDRLHCIKQHLQNPPAFQSAARELLEWCSDTRAFQLQFEEGLMNCLTVVSKVSAQPGFDLDLGYRLLAVCASHKEMFTPKSAGLLTTWSEELGRSLLLRHQKNRPGSDLSKSPPGAMHPQMQKTMPPVHHGGDAGWGGPTQGQPGHQSLSVVTTIWGVTPATQSGPYSHNPQGYSNSVMTGGSTVPHPGAQQPGMPAGAIQKGGASGPYPQGIYRRDSHPSGYPPTPNTPGSNPPNSSVGEYTAPPGALSAAAFVAAAATATATATATASMVALQEQQNHQQMNMQMNMSQQYGPQMQVVSNFQTTTNQAHFRVNTLMGPGQAPYGPQYSGMAPSQRHPGSMPMAHGPGPGPGPMGSKGSLGPMSNMAMYHRRQTPYPNAHQFLQQKRQMQYPNGTQMEFGPSPGQIAYQTQTQYMGKPQYAPTQQPLPSPTYAMPPHQAMRPVGPGQAPYPNGQSPYLMQGQYAPSRPPTQSGFAQYPGQQNNFQHSPVPGNPTPPMTPGAVPQYQGGEMKPSYPPDIKPHLIKRDNDELRLTFPVRDGVVLPPFRLEHNLAVSNHVFHLRESVYQTLMWRSDLELQLKCFHHEDRQMNTNWPASVTVSVNATPLTIERGENKSSHKPLYLKEVCQGGRNTIQITVTACCCSHLFVLQLVHRPSIRSVLQGLLRKRLLPAEHCITKIKRNFSSVAANSVNGEDGVEQTAIKVPLKCPITCRRITLPARGHDCKHIQCFDLESYLQLNCERGTWRCPVCNKTALLEGLEIDQYIWAILTNLNSTEFEEVTIDQAASWKPVQLKTIKEEEPDSCGRWKNSMSPSSMQLPTMSTWDFGGQHSPYSALQTPPQGTDQMNPAMRPTDPNHMSNHSMGGRPPSLPGRMTPSTQHGGPGTPQQQNGSHPLSHPPSSSTAGTGSLGGGLPECPNLPDLNFDPTAIMNVEPNSQNLDLLPENLGDPLELLSYLGPPDTNATDANGASSGNTNNSGDDILAFFES